MEAQVAAAVVEAAEEVEHGVGVGEHRRSQAQRAAVAQDDVADVLGVVGAVGEAST